MLRIIAEQLLYCKNKKHSGVSWPVRRNGFLNAAEGNTILKRERKNEQWYNQKTDFIEQDGR